MLIIELITPNYLTWKHLSDTFVYVFFSFMAHLKSCQTFKLRNNLFLLLGNYFWVVDYNAEFLNYIYYRWFHVKEHLLKFVLEIPYFRKSKYTPENLTRKFWFLLNDEIAVIKKMQTSQIYIILDPQWALDSPRLISVNTFTHLKNLYPCIYMYM